MREPTGRGFKYGTLSTLYARCRSLPGDRRALCKIVSPLGPPDARGTTEDPLDQPRLKLLRRRTAALLRELAKQSDEQLLRALSHGQARWDQVDALGLVPAKAHVLRKTLAADWRAFAEAAATETQPAARAAMQEAIATLDTSFDLLQLMERRLATFVRLRLQSASESTTQEDRLMPDGRPFLDVARALLDTAEAYS